MSAPLSVPWRQKLLNLLWPRDPLTGERRSHKRHGSSEKVTLSWKTPSPGTMTVEMKDVSVDGMRVEMPEAVHTPLVVRISGQSREHLGVVLYCNRSGSKFQAGIQLLDPDDPVAMVLEC